MPIFLIFLDRELAPFGCETLGGSVLSDHAGFCAKDPTSAIHALRETPTISLPPSRYTGAYMVMGTHPSADECDGQRK